MSLAVEGDRRGRSRSTSRDRRQRDDVPQEPLTYADVREPSYVYPEDDLDDRHRSGRRADPPRSSGALPYPDSGFDQMLPGNPSLYSYSGQQPIYRTASPSADASYRSGKDKADGHLPGAFPSDDRQDDDQARPRFDKRDSYGRRDEDPRSRYGEQSRSKNDLPALDDDKLKFLPAKYSRSYEDKDSAKKDRYSRTYADEDVGKQSDRDRDRRDRTGRGYDDDRRDPELDRDRRDKYGRKYDDEEPSRFSDREKDRKKDRRRKDDSDNDDLAYGKVPPPRSPRPDSQETYGSFFSNAQLAEQRSSRYGAESGPDRRQAAETYDPRRPQRDSYLGDPRASGSNVLTVEPGSRDRDRSRDRRRDKSPGPSTLTVEPGSRDRDRSRDRRGGREPSPQPPTARMSNLSVDTGRPTHLTLAAAPGSPMLESYHGTYQDLSPMPSPLLLASQNPSDDPRVFEPLSPMGSDIEGDGKRRNRRARFHDPEDIASRIAKALTGTKAPDIGPLIDVLPSLTHEQVMELRTEYKRLVKTPDRKGVNVAKHIRSRLKDEDPNLRKACYSVALGMWESEAYWANFWYQGDKTRRELLIESLMGRTNEEIRRIKDAFTDKKYDNSLTKCMKTELKEDKFKKAVLMVLDERRMEEYDGSGRRLPLDYQLVDQDVADLRKALKSEKGGESAMIAIVVQRSDTHLRAVLKEYEHSYRGNFARDSLKKSGNLVGELLAHILNGVINRPVRDALLLHHAVTASRKDSLRRELLISRLIRFHWDPRHMNEIKKAYRERYGQDLQTAIRDATSGEWGLFCSELCIARVPNDVRRVERVEKR